MKFLGIISVDFSLMKLLGIISVDFNIIDQLLIRYWMKNGSTLGQYINC